MTRSPSFALRSPLLPLVAAMLAALPALAQQAPADTGTLQTITITATKRLQPLQSTPIAVSVLSGADLEEANLNSFSSIASQLPSVNYRANASAKDANLFIRGVGTVSTSPGVEPTVSTVIDGVVVLRSGQAMLDLVEVERIEVLRGPQGTLFGKNASAGAINIVTRAPGKGLGGYVDLSAYEGNEKRVRLGLNGGNDMVRASLSALKGSYDGNVTNVFDGSKVNGYDRSGLRGRLEVTPNKDLKITVIADEAKSKDSTPTGVAVSTDVRSYPANTVTSNPLFASALAPVVASPTNRSINSEMKSRYEDTNRGGVVQIDWNFGGHQLTSITAHRTWELVQFQDQDRLSAVYKQFAQTADRGDLNSKQTSQELRIASTQRGFVEYVAGLFYIDGKTDEQYRRDVTRCAGSTATALPSGLVPCSAGSITSDNGVANYGVHSTGKAIFGEGTFNFTPALRSIAGLRYTKDDLSNYHSRVSTASATNAVPGVGLPRSSTGSTSNSAVTGRFGPQYDVNKDVMVYATYSRGYKGPAYNVFFNMNVDGRDNNPLSPEKSNSYEAGIKSELLNRTLRLNVAVFKTDFQGYQANVFDTLNGTVITRTINAGDVESSGLEVDATARVTPDLTINASVANTHARIKQFNCPTGAAASCDVNGKPLPFAPDWKGAVRLKYTQALGGKLSLDYGLETTWQSKTNFDLSQQPDSMQPSYNIVNASVTLNSTAGWRLSLVGKNLGDKSYSSLLQNSPGQAITRYVPRDDQRYFGLNFRYDF